MKDKAILNNAVSTNRDNFKNRAEHFKKNCHSEFVPAFLLCLVFFLVPENIFPLGIGPQIDFSGGTDFENPIFEAGLSCSIKTDNVPLSLGFSADWSFSEKLFRTNATCDYWIFNPQVSDYASFFTGFGGMAGISFGDLRKNEIFFNAAPRLFFGLNWILFDGFLEYFVQIAAMPEFSFNSERENSFALKFPCNAGIRFYF